MKRYFLLGLFVLLCLVPSWAFRTTITSTIYVNSVGPTPNNASIRYLPAQEGRVQFINHTTSSIPELAIAMEAASRIFTEEMEQTGIELIPIIAEVEIGDVYDFEFDELCQVDVEYTDTLIPNPCYPAITSNNAAYLPTLYPKVLSNQARGFCNGKCMTIRMNPSLIADLHCDTTLCPSTMYDATTVLLRALVIGSGVQSSLRYIGDSLAMGLWCDDFESLCATSFDGRIFNNSGYHPEDVIMGDIPIEYFLENEEIYTLGEFITENTSTYNPIQLTNDWEYGNALLFPVTSNTLNTIDFFNYTDDEILDDFKDLLSVEIEPGRMMRSLTRYTKAILRHLGFKFDIAVGNNGNYYSNLYNSHLNCIDHILLANNNYNISMSHNNVAISNLHCEIFGADSTYTIGNISYGMNGYTFTYDNIPDDVQWQRNPISKNIIGQFKAMASLLVDNHLLQHTKLLAIEIPYRPNRPIVQKSETTDVAGIHLDLSAFADGSNSYFVKYTGVTDHDVHTFNIAANNVDTTIVMTANQLYNFMIYGTNATGNSDTCTFTAGFSCDPTLHMTTSVNGNTLRYDLSNNGYIDVSDVVITSVRITDRMGNLLLTSTAGSGEPIDISSLARGYYLLWVEANGHTYGARFGKSTL